MPSGPFNPLEFTAHASLNGILIHDPASPNAAAVAAETLCSRDALYRLAHGCGLTWTRADRIADDLSAAAQSGNQSAAQAANDVLLQYGRRLGALIVTLRNPATAARQARNPQQHACLAHWATVDSIVLAGGLLAGRSGNTITAAAAALVQTAVQPCKVDLASHPTHAPTIGLVLRRSPTAEGEAVAVADLGHTRIKPAVAIHDGTQLHTLLQLQPLPAPIAARADHVVHSVSRALICAVLAASSHHGFTGTVLVSIAAHVHRGAPAGDGHGTYSCLAGRTAEIKRRIALATGTEVTLEFVHDGTAAAAAATYANTATISAGTWLGAGFLPSGAPQRLRLSPALEIKTRASGRTQPPSLALPLTNTPHTSSTLRLSNVDRYWD